MKLPFFQLIFLAVFKMFYKLIKLTDFPIKKIFLKGFANAFNNGQKSYIVSQWMIDIKNTIQNNNYAADIISVSAETERSGRKNRKQLQFVFLM